MIADIEQKELADKAGGLEARSASDARCEKEEEVQIDEVSESVAPKTQDKMGETGNR